MRREREVEALVRAVDEYMTDCQMAPKGSHILAAVSGGADSVCLLLVLLILAKRYDWRISVAHVDHRIRACSGDDASFVRTLCEELKVPFYLLEVDVEAKAQLEGISTEEAGRLARYAFFRETADAIGADRIALAHNRKDQAETLLFRLFRGTGLTGMGGMEPVNRSVGRAYIRPLLSTTRESIEAWLTAQGQTWREDSTNREDAYTRNRIRHHILPAAVEGVNAQAEAHLAAAAELLARTDDYVRREAERGLQRCMVDSSGLLGRDSVFDVDAFNREDSYLQSEILHLVLVQKTAGGKDITAAHVNALLGLFSSVSGSRVSLPYGMEAVREFGRVILTAKQGNDFSDCAEKQASWQANAMSLEEAQAARWLTYRILGRSEWEAAGGSTLLDEKAYTKYLDYDIIQCPRLRCRQTGDYLCINDRMQQKKLKTYMIEEKIPAGERDRVPVLADGEHVLWVIGHRISAGAKVKDETEKILQVTWLGERTFGEE